MDFNANNWQKSLEDDSHDDQLDFYLQSSDHDGLTTSQLNFHFPVQGSFCTNENFVSSLQYINQTLYAYGYPSPIETTSETGGVKVVNTIHALLQQRQRDIEYKDSVQDRLSRMSVDRDHMLIVQKKLEDKINSQEREAAMMMSKERSKEEQWRKAKDKLENEKDELTRQCGDYKHREAQYLHEIRKKEREYEKLREKLTHVLAEKNREQKAGMDILSSIQNGNKKRSNWKAPTGKSGEDEMYRMIIGAYETQQKELIQENSDLRESLRDLQSELQDLLNAQTHAHTTPTVNDTHFNMPFELVRSDIEDHMRSQMQRYKEHLSPILGDGNTENDDAMEFKNEFDHLILKEKIKQCMSVIREQENLLQMCIAMQSDSVNEESETEHRTSQIGLSKQYLEEENLLLEEKKKNFDEERKKFTAASLELARERLEIQKLRKQIENQVTENSTSISSNTPEKSPRTPKVVDKVSHLSFSPYGVTLSTRESGLRRTEIKRIYDDDGDEDGNDVNEGDEEENLSDNENNRSDTMNDLNNIKSP